MTRRHLPPCRTRLVGDQRSTLNSPGEPKYCSAEHKDWPYPQRATEGEENDAKPANGISIDRDRAAVPAPKLTFERASFE
jgi:hypothetical protein